MKKAIAVILILLTVSVVFGAVTNAAVMATTYSTSLAFVGYHTGPTRYYTGSSSSANMNWKGTTYTENQLPNMSTTFTFRLYRKRFLHTDLIGTVTCSRDGYHNITWTNVGEGDYYFYYSKDSTDGVNVKSDAVILSMS